MAAISDISSGSFDSEILQAGAPVAVYFYAPWCKPCLEMDDVVQQVADEVGDKIRVVRVNTDAEDEIVLQQKIRTIPTVQVIKEGKSAGDIRGKLSKLELVQKLSAFIGGDPEEAPSSDTGEPEAQQEASET